MRPRSTLFWSILACLVAWQVAACTVMEPHRELVIWRGCDGMDHAADVSVQVGWPAFACIAAATEPEDVIAMVLGFPALGCAVVEAEDAYRVRRATVYLSPVNFDFVVAHEFDHVRGMEHPRGLSFARSSPLC